MAKRRARSLPFVTSMARLMRGMRSLRSRSIEKLLSSLSPGVSSYVYISGE